MVLRNSLSHNVSRKIDLRLAQRENALLKLYSHRVHHDLLRQRLTSITDGMDHSLIERLMELGFDSATLAAINLAPLAEVAWASGSVTKREQVVALVAVLSSDMFNAYNELELFQSWLLKRPDKALWLLWEDYTTTRLACSKNVRDEEFARRLLEVATRVALASGGLLNQGEICVTEQRVLDRIARVYKLSPEHS